MWRVTGVQLEKEEKEEEKEHSVLKVLQSNLLSFNRFIRQVNEPAVEDSEFACNFPSHSLYRYLKTTLR